LKKGSRAWAFPTNWGVTKKRKTQPPRKRGLQGEGPETGRSPPVGARNHRNEMERPTMRQKKFGSKPKKTPKRGNPNTSCLGGPILKKKCPWFWWGGRKTTEGPKGPKKGFHPYRMGGFLLLVWPYGTTVGNFKKGGGSFSM